MREVVVVLHNIRSMHNVGSIFRTSDAAGVARLYLCGFTPAPLDQFGEVRPQIRKVALGAEGTVPWEKAASAPRLVSRLKRDGYKILSLELASGSVPYDALPASYKKGRVALVLGHEIKGLPKSIIDRSDKVVAIPMRGTKESLNVSVAFGIAVYAITRQGGV